MRPRLNQRPQTERLGYQGRHRNRATHLELTVAGLDSSDQRWFKFPDGTIQTTRAVKWQRHPEPDNLQTGANFNIAGTGAADIFNATTQLQPLRSAFVGGDG